MSFESIGELTFPQSYQLTSALMDAYREQKRVNEGSKIQGVIQRMRNGR